MTFKEDFEFYCLSLSSPPSSRSPLSWFVSVIMLAAARKGDAKKLAELIRQSPGFDVNKGLDEWRNTLLHHACNGDHRSAIIPLLLAHPGIDANVKSVFGGTPFSYACANGLPSCVREMLKDSRVEVNEPDRD